MEGRFVSKVKSWMAFLLIAVVVIAASGVFLWRSFDDVRWPLGEGAAVEGAPRPWEWNFQPPHSQLAAKLYGFHNFLLVINVAICGIVVVLLAFVLWRFSASRNPTPSRTSHNTVLEVVWTVVPVFVLAAIALPSFALLAELKSAPQAGVTIKVTGHQWYWDFAYPDLGGFQFSSMRLQDPRLGDHSDLRLLMTDELVVLPVDTVVRIEITSADVIHGFTIPSLGIKRDAVPGRLNETWVKIDREGTYYGQCSVLCGQDHAFMPIAIKAVSKREFDRWVKTTRARFSAIDPGKRDRLAAVFDRNPDIVRTP